MTIYVPGKLVLHQPQYPAAPAAGEEWTDPSTGTVWVYDDGNWILSYNNWSFTVNTQAVTPGVTTFSIITDNLAACYCEIDWGDGQKQPITIRTGVVTTTHTYATAGTYEINVRDASGAFRPYYNNNAEVKKITELGASQLDWSFGTTLERAWYGGSNITLIDAGINTSGVTNFSYAWYGFSSLATFPLIDTSSGTNFISTWRSCTFLTTFPLIDASSGTNFFAAWLGCSSLTTFPLIGTSSGTNFSFAWNNCSSLTTFPANFFDNWTATPANNCFLSTWDGCSALTATSVENILNSIDTSGRNAPASGVDITIDYNASSGTPNISTAVTNLKSRGWTITLNGVAQ